MNLSFRTAAAVIAFGLGAIVAQSARPAQADLPGAHPEYVHALSDLRYAHWLLQFPSAWNVTEHERSAIGYVDRAFRDVRRAGIDDGKDVNAPMNVDANLTHRNRLVRALASLQSAHRDVNGWESDPYARGPRAAADGNLDSAIQQVRFALRDQRRNRNDGY